MNQQVWVILPFAMSTFKRRLFTSSPGLKIVPNINKTCCIHCYSPFFTKYPHEVYLNEHRVLPVLMVMDPLSWSFISMWPRSINKVGDGRKKKGHLSTTCKKEYLWNRRFVRSFLNVLQHFSGSRDSAGTCPFSHLIEHLRRKSFFVESVRSNAIG